MLPDFETPEGFDAGAVAGRRPWQWLATAPQTVTLNFAPGSEPLGERVFDAHDGKLSVSYLDGLIPLVLSLGDRVWIESPPQAREKVVNALRSLKARQIPAAAQSGSAGATILSGTRTRTSQPPIALLRGTCSQPLP